MVDFLYRCSACGERYPRGAVRYLCPVCGDIEFGTLPEKCPLCGALASDSN